MTLIYANADTLRKTRLHEENADDSSSRDNGSS